MNVQGIIPASLDGLHVNKKNKNPPRPVSKMLVSSIGKIIHTK